MTVVIAGMQLCAVFGVIKSFSIDFNMYIIVRNSLISNSNATFEQNSFVFSFLVGISRSFMWRLHICCSVHSSNWMDEFRISCFRRSNHISIVFGGWNFVWLARNVRTRFSHADTNLLYSWIIRICLYLASARKCSMAFSHRSGWSSNKHLKKNCQSQSKRTLSKIHWVY